MTIDRTAAASFVSNQAGRTVKWVGSRLDPLGDTTAVFETVSVLDAFLPSLMPRTSQHQGLATGLHLLGARLIGGRINVAHAAIIGSTATPVSLGVRAATALVGEAVSQIPEREDETLWVSAARTSGDLLRAAAISGAAFDAARMLRAGRFSNRSYPLVTGAMLSTGAVYWAARRLRHRKQVIPRWPVDQQADIPTSIAIGAAIGWVGTGLGKAFVLTGRGFRHYLGDELGKPVLGAAANTAAWALGAVSLYNAGVASIGRSNERVEPSYATAPTSPLLSGSPESVSRFSELGLQGRRYVTDVVTPEMIENVVGEPAVQPIRTYVGFNSVPLYQTGRAELALLELERTGAFDRPFLLLVSPTGTGWVDQTVVEAAEFFARGNIATCSVQYGRFPSFLAVQKVGLGRGQFRLLLWGIRQRLLERPPERRPKVLVFGESLGAWTASDVVMAQGIRGFDHYGIDKALWFGLPALAKWSRNGMSSGSNRLVPDGTVGVFDSPQQLAGLDDEARERLRAVILSHHNDPIASLRPELMIRRPDWLRGEPGRNVPEDMDWVPINTFLQVMIDAANAMVTVPGEFKSFGHDYRGDTARFVRDGFGLPGTTDEQTERIEAALRRLDVERIERIKRKPEDPEDPRWSAQIGETPFSAGVPLMTRRTEGARWFR